MDFGAALKGLHLDKPQRRSGWENMFIHLEAGRIMQINFTVEHGVKHTASQIWTPTQPDILATDWQEYQPNES